MQNILCSLNVHKWIYSTETRLFLGINNGSHVREDTFRECERCHLKQELNDEGEPKVSVARADRKITKFLN